MLAGKGNIRAGYGFQQCKEGKGIIRAGYGSKGPGKTDF